MKRLPMLYHAWPKQVCSPHFPPQLKWDGGTNGAPSEFGMKIEMLMENASREALAVLALEETGPVAGQDHPVLFAGPGNNGGDAIALATASSGPGGRIPIVLSYGSQKPLQRRQPLPSAQLARPYRSPHFKLLRADLHFQLPRIRGKFPDIIIDGLLGTGFHRRITSHVSKNSLNK